MWVSQAWDEIKLLTLVRSWRKLLNVKATEKWTGETPEYINETFNSEEGNQIAELVKHLPGCEGINNKQVNEWLGEDDVKSQTVTYQKW